MKGLSIVICCLVVFGLAGCTQSDSGENSAVNSANETATTEQSEDQNTAGEDVNSSKEPGTEKPSAEQAESGKEPDFKNYPAGEEYTGETAKLVFDSKTSEFKTRLQEAAAGKVNFAGHYIVAQWGCGTDCAMGGVIDAKTGKTSVFPFTVCCNLEDGDESKDKMEFRKDSNLIIFNGLLDEKDEDGKVHYYEFKDGELKKLAKL